MLAFMAVRRTALPMRFYALHIVSTVACAVCSLLSVFMPEQSWVVYINILMIVTSVLGWVLLLTEKKEKRAAAGLRWRGKIRTALGVCLLFFVLKTAMMFLSAALSGAEYWSEYLAYWQSFVPWYYMLLLIPTSFSASCRFLGRNTAGGTISPRCCSSGSASAAGCCCWACCGGSGICR